MDSFEWDDEKAASRKVVGRIEGRLYCVVYTLRGRVRRIKESKAYG